MKKVMALVIYCVVIMTALVVCVGLNTKTHRSYGYSISKFSDSDYYTAMETKSETKYVFGNKVYSNYEKVEEHPVDEETYESLVSKGYNTEDIVKLTR